jgi:DNA-binding transcriptional LysR family regulator
MSKRQPVPFSRLATFAAVAEAGSFTGAALQLGIAKSLVSQDVAKLERELGTPLFVRTTRRVAMTEHGERLLGECRPYLQGLSSALDRFGDQAEDLTGTLKVTTVPEFAEGIIGTALAEFASRHPALQVDLVATSKVLDLVAERIDLAIRLGQLSDSSLRVTRLGALALYPVASPAYLERAGQPQRPEELEHHRWVAVSDLQSPLVWRFSDAEGHVVPIRGRPTARASTPQAVLGLVRGGAGISVLPDHLISGDLSTGRLVRVVGSWTLPAGGVYAVYPPSARVALHKVRMFIDFLKAGPFAPKR